MKDIKKTLADFYRARKRMPSYAELAKLAGYRSKNAVFKLVGKLEKESFLEKDARGTLLPRSLHGETKVLGVVEAGFPSAAEEELVDTMSLDDFLIQNKEATYILKVKGDSMIDAGILEGDMVVVERTPNVKEGQIVIAEVDGEWTIKFFRKKNGVPYLEPANKNFKPIYPRGNLKVAAVVKAVIRKL